MKHWNAFKKSIARLVLFSKSHEVKAVLGSHIEMSNRAGNSYPIGTTYHPDEAPLSLAIKDLVALNIELQKSENPNQIIFKNFIVTPMNNIQKIISSIVRWFTH